MNTLINQALEKHRNGDLEAAYVLYASHLKDFPDDSLALYGAGTIVLLSGNLEGLKLCERAIFELSHPQFDKSLASESTLQNLIHIRQYDSALAFLNKCLDLKISINNQSYFEGFLKLPSHLKPSHFDHQLKKELHRYRPLESERYVYAIDIVGGCNLRCPTCPVANQGNIPKGLMSIELYKDILNKIKNEQGNLNPDIWLFNWGEPLLHPQIDQFILATKEFGMTSFISSNLNHGSRLEALMKASPDRMKISLSSLNQAIYEKTHARGKIDHVIDNLHELARLRDLYHAHTQIWIGHHLYKNTVNEQATIKELADKLGFGYAPSLAILAPIESIMNSLDSDSSNRKKSIPIFQDISQQFLHNPLEFPKNNALHRSGTKDCELRFNMTTIQYDGAVNLCCGTTQTISDSPIFFLDKTFEEIEDLKYNSSFCKKCMEMNLHLTIPDQ